MTEGSDHDGSNVLEDPDYMSLALEGFKVNLGLEDESSLIGRVQLHDVLTGTFLIRQESLQVTILYAIGFYII